MTAKRPKLAPIALTTTENQPQDQSENAESDIGRALRAAYESAVQEDIPVEMLDLLSKLR